MTRTELAQALALLPADAVLTLPVHELRAALVEGEAARGGALACAAHNGNGSAPDRLLSAKEAAARLGVSPRYVYAHRRHFPFARELPGGALRFSDAGLTRWLARTP